MQKIKLLKKALGAQCTYASYSKEKLFNEESGEWEMSDCVKVRFTDKSVYTIAYKNPLDIKHLYMELLEARDNERSTNTI